VLGIGAVIAVAAAGAAALIACNQFRSPQADHVADYSKPAAAPDDLSWQSYGGDPGHKRYSPIAQITPANVAHLRQAWIYRTGEPQRRGQWGRHGKVQATPIIVAGSLVFCTPFSRAIALDPATGAERWVHDPGLGAIERRPGERFNCRGLAHWHDPAVAPGGHCADRLFLPTTDRRLVALDARDGKPCSDFGDQGTVRVALGRPGLEEGELQFASAPAVAADVVVIGSASGDNQRAAGIPGTVHAFDVRSGAPRWTFEPIATGTTDGESAATGSAGSTGSARSTSSTGSAGSTASARAPAVTGQANVWGPISVDVERNLVFLPTSSPSPDFYGGLRPGDNRHANSVVAVDARTGRIAWHFQTVHHDLWDYDVPAAPSLFDWRSDDGRTVPALVFATKSGFVFVLDRLTGKPLTAVEERPVAASDVPGEQAAPSQPFSTGQPVLSPQRVDIGDAFGVLGFDWYACRQAIAGTARRDGLFTPPSLGGTLLVPMGAGGANWGGVAIDPASNRVFVNTNHAIHRVTLLPAVEAARRRSLEPGRDIGLMAGAPYGMLREVLLSPLGLPCNKPPWGSLAAVDVQSGRLAWQVPLGNSRKLAPLGLSFAWGTANFGGPIVTAGGVLFIAATMDDLLRAFDPKSGAELWAGELPYSAMATPMTYALGGRQYVVVAAGGHPVLGRPVGDALVAFALP
jgi:quinoprotein glucose dehydrogenase